MPNAIFLSPHLDDAIYSCGGLIARQVRQEQSVTVLTVFAGDPPDGPLSTYAEELHHRWGAGRDAIEYRREEDLKACGRLGAAAVHTGVPEAIYRKVGADHHLYPTEEEVFGELREEDKALVGELAAAFDEISPPGAYLYAPLALGGHVDHVLTRRAAETLERPVWYYHDFPYSARGAEPPTEFAPPRGVGTVLPLEDAEVEAWAQAIWTYQTQRSAFWADLREVRRELEEYLEQHSGIPVYAPSRRRKPQ